MLEESQTEEYLGLPHLNSLSKTTSNDDDGKKLGTTFPPEECFIGGVTTTEPFSTRVASAGMIETS